MNITEDAEKSKPSRRVFEVSDSETPIEIIKLLTAFPRWSRHPKDKLLRLLALKLTFSLDCKAVEAVATYTRQPPRGRFRLILLNSMPIKKALAWQGLKGTVIKKPMFGDASMSWKLEEARFVSMPDKTARFATSWRYLHGRDTAPPPTKGDAT
jgi:hypothetical protein